MSIHYLFSSNNKIGSKAIAWGSSLYPNHIKNLTNGIPSHVAVLLNNEFVIESVLESGVRIVPYKKWREINKELYKIKEDVPNYELVKDLLLEMWGKKYDWLGILYFAKCMFCHLVCKSELPQSNKWESENRFFCTEFAGRLSGHNYQMTTPAKMANDLLERI